MLSTAFAAIVTIIIRAGKMYPFPAFLQQLVVERDRAHRGADGDDRLLFLRFHVQEMGKQLDVPYVRPIPLFGNFLKIAMGIDHPLEFYDGIYRRFAGRKYARLFQMRTSYLMVRDPEMINDVLITDLAHFTDRGIYSDFAMNSMSNNLFFMENPQWKMIRNTLTPAITSGKLNTMYEQIKECGDELMKNIDRDLIRNGDQMEIRDVMGKFATDVTGTCAFGLKLNDISDDQSEFRKHGKSIFTPSLRTLFRELCLLVSPALLRVVRLKDFPMDAVDFFHSAYKQTIAYRKENKIVRNYIIQAVIQARNDLVLSSELPNQGKNYLKKKKR